MLVKKIWSNKFSAKNSGPKILGQKKFKAKKCLTKNGFGKKWSKTILGQTKFWSKEIFGPNHFDQRKSYTKGHHQVLSYIKCCLSSPVQFSLKENLVHSFLNIEQENTVFFIFVGIQLGGWQQILFPVWTPDNISDLTSFVVWLSR